MTYLAEMPILNSILLILKSVNPDFRQLFFVYLTLPVTMTFTCMDVLIFENKVCKVYYNAELFLGKVVWNGGPTLEEYKQPFLYLIDYSKQKEIYNFISDIIHQGTQSQNNRSWFESVMMPMAVEHGLKRGAIVTNANPFKKFYINMLLRVSNKFGLPVQIFSDQAEAEKWIKTFV